MIFTGRFEMILSNFRCLAFAVEYFWRSRPAISRCVDHGRLKFCGQLLRFSSSDPKAVQCLASLGYPIRSVSYPAFCARKVLVFPLQILIFFLLPGSRCFTCSSVFSLREAANMFQCGCPVSIFQQSPFEFPSLDERSSEKASRPHDHTDRRHSTASRIRPVLI